MFCPFCGIKNNAEQQSCFVCHKKLPSLDAEAPRVAPPPTNGRGGPRTYAKPTTPARFTDRFLAVVLDLLLIGAILLVAGAALWSRIPVIRGVSLAIVAACAASAAALLVFGYTWFFADATIGKAFAGIRVVRREQPLSLGRRIGMIALWTIAVAGAVWGTIVLWPR